MSDISGAFDKVFAKFLLAKLRQLGVGDTILKFFSEYLQPRRAHVVVAGSSSDEFEISDMVYQGTVLGPLLWNTFFADVAVPATANGEREIIFADDLNIFNVFDRNEDNDVIHAELASIRRRVHK